MTRQVSVTSPSSRYAGEPSQSSRAVYVPTPEASASSGISGQGTRRSRRTVCTVFAVPAGPGPQDSTRSRHEVSSTGAATGPMTVVTVRPSDRVVV